MKIAIVGTGISGLAAAHLLHEEHDLALFEANDYVGGHTHTHDVESRAGTVAVDTGFIVFNEETYPNFVRLLDRLGVPSQPSDMSFGVRDERTGLEYSPSRLAGVLAQPRNALRPSFLRMLRDIVRFNRASKALLARRDDRTTLGAYLAREGYSRAFIERAIIPMGAAVWSADPASMLEFPARYFVRFFHNHRMLELRQPQWRVIRGGSREYVRRLIRPFEARIRLRTPVEWIARRDDAVIVKARGAAPERFDHAILASHADQSLALLRDPSEAEREALSAFPYQRNDTALHTDESILPRAKAAWASWNYHVLAAPDAPGPGRATLTYWMNRLQSLRTPENYCVTLNRTQALDRARIVKELVYHHPVYRPEAVAAQGMWEKVNGARRTWFAGAYWGYGFHEDGVKSALRVCERFGRAL